jgi:hypothetical protein
MEWEVLYLERMILGFIFSWTGSPVTSISHSPSSFWRKPNLCAGVGCEYDTLCKVPFPRKLL